VVLTHSVQAGTELTASDVSLARVAEGLVPDGALTAAESAIGQRVTTRLPAGMTLVPEVLTDGGTLFGAPDGSVVVPVRLSDASVASLVHPGDRIDVLASPGVSGGGTIAPAQELASAATVVEVPDGAEGPAELVLLAVTPREAQLLGGAASWAILTAVLVG
jgi:Flp pilus assembly protein CpaB